MDTYHSSIRKDIVHLVPESENLLDVGGGYGATARHLKQIGRAQKIGVMDAVIGDHCKGLDSYFAGDLDDRVAVRTFLNEAGPFDAILLLDVLEHLVDPWTMVRVLAEAVRPGGVMIASIPNIRHLSVSTRLLFRDEWQYADVGLLDRTHLRFFVKDTAIELMSVPGVQIDKVEPSPLGSRKHKLLNAVTFGQLRSFFTLQYFIVARRAG